MLTEHSDRPLPYYLYEPDLPARGPRPVILHIHGAGSRGKDLKMAADNNPEVRYAAAHADFPFRIYGPQCGEDTWFDCYERLLSFVDLIREREAGAPLYLTGISMGGYCSWQLLQSRPDTFRRALICCGGGMYWNAARILTPVRIFHGEQDTVVYPEESRRMAQALSCAGRDAALTVYPDLAHDVWSRVFSDPQNYAWLLS